MLIGPFVVDRAFQLSPFLAAWIYYVLSISHLHLLNCDSMSDSLSGNYQLISFASDLIIHIFGKLGCGFSSISRGFWCLCPASLRLNDDHLYLKADLSDCDD